MPQTVLKFKLGYAEEEPITPNAGLGLYAELYKGVGLDREVKKQFPEPGSGAGYEADEYVKSIVLMMIGGGRYLEDIRKIQMDEGLKKIAQMKRVPTADGIGDWMRRESEKKMGSLQRISDELSGRVLKRAREPRVTVDIDATGVEAEKYEAKYTYKGYKGYMPMLGFIPELDWCIGYEFREGNESPASRNYEFLLEIIGKIEKSGKEVGWMRSDSAAYQAVIFNKLNGRGIRYAVTVDQDKAVQSEIARIPEGQWKKLKDRDGFQTGREVAEFIHSMGKTDHAFRVVVQRWPNPQKDLFEQSAEYCYHGIASNALEEEKSQEELIYWHNGRSTSENYNKEIKIGFNLEYMPCGDFGANGVWFGFGILAYQLFVMSKLYLFPETWLKKTIRTVRWQLLQIAGKLIKSSRQWTLRICGTGREIYDIYRMARMRCWELKATF